MPKTYQATLTERQCRLLAEVLTASHPINRGNLGDFEPGSDEDELGVLLEWFDEPGTHLVLLDDE